LLALLERSPHIFRVERIPKNDFVMLVKDMAAEDILYLQNLARGYGNLGRLAEPDFSEMQTDLDTPSKYLLVGNVPLTFNADQVLRELEQHGEVEGLHVVNQQGRRYSLCAYVSANAAAAAMEKLLKSPVFSGAVLYAHWSSTSPLQQLMDSSRLRPVIQIEAVIANGGVYGLVPGLDKKGPSGETIAPAVAPVVAAKPPAAAQSSLLLPDLQISKPLATGEEGESDDASLVAISLNSLSLDLTRSANGGSSETDSTPSLVSPPSAAPSSTKSPKAADETSVAAASPSSSSTSTPVISSAPAAVVAPVVAIAEEVKEAAAE